MALDGQDVMTPSPPQAPDRWIWSILLQSITADILTPTSELPTSQKQGNTQKRVVDHALMHRSSDTICYRPSLIICQSNAQILKPQPPLERPYFDDSWSRVA